MPDLNLDYWISPADISASHGEVFFSDFFPKSLRLSGELMAPLQEQENTEGNERGL
jgi:hypothetical protein